MKPAKLLQITLSFVMQIFLCFGLVSSGLGVSAALPLVQTVDEPAQVSTESLDIALDVDRAAENADQASEDIYRGLDTTKQVIGKTDKRNQIIEQAREQASQNWKSLADKAKATKHTDTSLTSTEERVLRQVQD